jgi:plastocyanin
LARNILPAIGALLLVGTLCVPAEAARYAVTIRNMGFGAAPAHLKTGDVLQWTNDDMFQHTATADGFFDLDLAPGKGGEITLKKPGTLNVYCRYHPNMKMKLTVAP